MTDVNESSGKTLENTFDVPPAVESFQTNRVTTIAAGHAIHDTYTAFLPPILPSLIESFALSKTQAGLLSAFMQGPSILQPFIGHLADRISLRYLVILAPAATGTAMSLLGVASAYYVLVLLLLLAGITSAGLHAVGPVMAGRISGRSLGKGMSFWMVGGELGRTIGPIILVTVVGLMGLKSTPWLMVGGWLASITLFIRFRDIPGKPLDNDGALPWQDALRQMRPLMVPLTGIIVVRAFMSASLTTYLPTFLSEEGVDLWIAGASLSILEAAGVVGALAGGSISDRLGRRLVLFLSMLTTPLLTLAFLASDGWVRLALLPIIGLVALSTTPVIMAMVQESYPSHRAFANGIYMATSFLIFAVVVVLLGGLGDWLGLRWGFFISAALMLLSLPLLRFLPLGEKVVSDR